MADTKITGLQPPQAGYSIVPSTDVLPIVVVADPGMAASGSTRKATVNQILGAGGTATLASATITGDLTVDTSTLKVDSTNNRVGIRTASPTQILSINGDTFVSSPFNGIALGDNAAERLRIGYKDGTPDTGLVPAQIVTQASVLQIATRDIVNGAITLHTGTGVAERFRIAGDGVATWSNVGGVAGTAMTLDSTGLGVGVTPVSGSGKFQTVGGATYSGEFDIISALTNVSPALAAAKGVLIGYNNTTNNGIISAAYGSGTEGLQFWTHNGSSWGSRMTLDSAGNVGIGVTPSASTIRTVQSQYGVFVGSDELNIASNAYFGSSWKYISAATAARYSQASGVHYWFTAAAGAAVNDPVTSFTAATAKMTLDVNGNLILLSSSTPASLSTNGQLTVNATSNTNLRFSYRGSDGTTRVANITLA